MAAPSPSPTQTSTVTASSLIASGLPFQPFPAFSILKLLQPTAPDSSPPFSEWLTKRLQLGLPVVIRDFDKLPEWNKEEFGVERLIELSTKKNIPIRNCSTGRDLSFTLRKFADAARQSHSEFQNLYARDLQCPGLWLEKCLKILPSEVQWGGRLDLFQWLPACARSEVMMAYVGSEGSSSGFHRCFSSTVALNLLIEAHDGAVTCFGTDFESQTKYDSFMSARGVSPHLDWVNLPADELRKADFPLYVLEQQVGDLVVYPPATAHQIWNTGTVTTKVVWNILHPLSLEVGFNYVQPGFNRLCSPDVARTSLSLACAMLSLIRTDPHKPGILPPNLPLLSRLFRRMVDDDSIRGTPTTTIQLVTLPETVIATCDFCGTAIWNRHVRCTECNDFDLCLCCFLAGRSCEHASSYSWAEIVPESMCMQALSHAREILGFHDDEAPNVTSSQKSLGTAVNELMQIKQSPTTRLCHLCRIDHPEWKGRPCDKCSAFFCYRGLYRHFDVQSASIIRRGGLWTCPKCLETCNCRCCHFASAYVKAEKPASKRRVKAADPRGKTMGFTDNVFDQKRGQKSNAAHSTSHSALNKSHKRQSTSDLPEILQRPPRSIELPTPESELANAQPRPPGYYDGILANLSPKLCGPITGPSLYMPMSNDPNAACRHAPQIPPSSNSSNTPPRSASKSSTSRANRPADGMRTLAAAAASRDRMQVDSLSPITPTQPSMDDVPFPSNQNGPFNPLLSNILSPCSQPNSSSDPQQQQQTPQSPSTTTTTTTTTVGPGHPAPTSSSTSTTPLTHPSNSNSHPNPDPKPHHLLSDPSSDPIASLDASIQRLRRYGDELLELNMRDSYSVLSAKVAGMETRLRDLKSERARMLIGRLEGEGGWLGADLASLVKEEGGRLGYV